MTRKHACWAVALATVLAVPAFAQSQVNSASGVTVTSGTGVVVTPGIPARPVGTVSSVPAARLGGATVATAGTSTTVASNGPGSSTTTTVTRYWMDVPPDATRDSSFQRWQSLK